MLTIQHCIGNAMAGKALVAFAPGLDEDGDESLFWLQRKATPAQARRAMHPDQLVRAGLAFELIHRLHQLMPAINDAP